MTVVARPVSPRELAELLSPDAAARIDAAALADAHELLDERDAALARGERVPPLPDPLEPFAYEYCDGRLEVLIRDRLEAGIGHGGQLLSEFVVGTGLARCLVCGGPNPADPRPWCTRRCRNLLRREGRRRWPDADDATAIARASSWAVRERNLRLGWFIPLTREVAESLYLRGDS